jgi:hypothetical protein
MSGYNFLIFPNLTAHCLNKSLMKSRSAITLLLFLSFVIYTLCPILMQGHCGFSVSEARCSSLCDSETEGASQQEHPTQNCCIIDLKLSRPASSKPIPQILQANIPLPAALPTLSAVPTPNPSAFRKDQHTEDCYDYLPVHSSSSRAPPFFLS